MAIITPKGGDNYPPEFGQIWPMTCEIAGCWGDLSLRGIGPKTFIRYMESAVCYGRIIVVRFGRQIWPQDPVDYRQKLPDDMAKSIQKNWYQVQWPTVEKWPNLADDL